MRFLAAALLIFLCGCDNMRNDSKLKPLEESKFFADGRSARTLVDGTVPRGFLNADTHLTEGKVDGKLAETFPFPIDEKVLNEGEKRYEIYCAACHDAAGTGDGMIVRRGFKKPASFHDPRLKQAQPGYFFDVMTHGIGFMSDYAAELTPEERWAVAAYIRVLQEGEEDAW